MLFQRFDAGAEDGFPQAPTQSEDCQRCGGTGWFATPYDTHERCGMHYNGQRHPEFVLSDEAGSPPADEEVDEEHEWSKLQERLNAEGWAAGEPGYNAPGWS